MAYEFEHTVTDKENFIYKYIEYGMSQTDAPYEFHELYAMSLLGIASHGITAPSPGSHMGMQLNCYALIHGTSAISRKSTCMTIAEQIMESAIGQGYGETNDFTPEGLLEALERNDGRPMVVYMDEFTLLLDKMVRQFMGGIKAILLKLYAKSSHKYTRTSKGTGKNKVVDEVEIKEAHLNIVGNVTTMIADRFTEIDLQDGFLGRFIIISPTGKPDSKPFRYTKNPVAEVDLIEHLSVIAHGCQECKEWARTNNRGTVDVDQLAIDIQGKYQRKIERLIEDGKITDMQYILIQRAPSYAMKAACWISLGEVDARQLAHGPLYVTEAHMKLGIILADKWKDYAMRFCENIGNTRMEKQMTKIIRDLGMSSTHSASKSSMMRKYRLAKDECDRIEATLIAREQIIPKQVVGESTNNRAKTRIEWFLSNGARPMNSPAQGARLEDTTQTSPEPGEN